MTPSSANPLRILACWGSPTLKSYFASSFLKNPRYKIEVVSGDRSKEKSPDAASWARLWSLRRRLERGEFDLVLSSPIHNSPWPRPKRLATCLAQAFRYFTYKHRMLDSYWASWLLSGKLRGKIPLTAIDYLDTSYVLPRELPLLRASTLYFKSNLSYWPERALNPLESIFGMDLTKEDKAKIRPLTYGFSRSSIPDTARPMRERDIDICFTGTIIPARSEGDISPFPELTSNPIRRDIYERCLKLKEKYNVYCVDRVVPFAEYKELLQRSKLMVSTESFGCETSRHYSASSAGAIPLINWTYAQNYRQLEPDIHAIYFSLIGDDFERVVDQALASPEKLDRISQATRAYTIAEKEQQHIADHVIDETLRQHAAQSSSLANVA